MDALKAIERNTDTIIGQASLEERLKSGKRLRVKLGVDPTRPDLTFGHMVVFNKLRQFQELGHEAILIIGDYTTLIGDPSGRSSTRPVLTREEIEQNASTYLDQAFRILDKNKTTVYHNSEWFMQMRFEDCLNLARKMTVAQMLERDDFSKRHAANTPISIVEFLYPLLQGYDSVHIKADVELGGTDQLFNLLVGRTLQKDAEQPEQIVITMPLLVGLDGVKKMSKSQDNYIAFSDTAKNMFGKIMSISDTAMWDYYQYLLEWDDAAITEWKEKHPMDAKKHLAQTLLARFHGDEAADYERQQFEQVFSQRELPDDMPTFPWSKLTKAPSANLIDLLAATDLFPSKKEIRRLVEQGAVHSNEERCNDIRYELAQDQAPFIIRAGKRTFLKIEA
ncbi:MAG TPA: tyrosine--tRNA ligase [Opitutae bacterium]|nr:tyrosine--tRNA ligase [Opitutae bacterium]